MSTENEAVVWRWQLGARFGWQEEDPTQYTYTKPYVWTKYVPQSSIDQRDARIRELEVENATAHNAGFLAASHNLGIEMSKLYAHIAALESQLRDQAMQRVSDFCQEQEAAARQPLTDEQIMTVLFETEQQPGRSWNMDFARAIEAAHGITGDSHE